MHDVKDLQSRAVEKHVGVEEMKMSRWKSGYTLKDRISKERINKKLEVASMRIIVGEID